MAGRALILERLLGGMSPQAFFEAHWLKSPLVVRGGGAAFVGLADRARVDALVQTPACDLLVVRDGALWKGPRPATGAEARARFDEGYSLALRWVDRHDPDLAAFGRGLAREVHAALNLQLYCTPKGRGSFGWHCDPEEVLILQTHGTKRYRYRRNTVNPAPLLDALGGPAELARETSPLEESLLAPGDLLYLPGGYWHETRADEDSISLSVGLLPPTAIDALDLLRAELAASPRWRARFPPLGHASAFNDAQVLERAGALIAELREELASRLDDPSFAIRFLTGFATGGRRLR